MYNNIQAFKMPRSFVCVDLETSDFLERGGEIIEIGAVKVINREVVDSFSSLCALNPGEHWGVQAERVHGIHQSDLIDAPMRSEVIHAFAGFVQDLPLLGHNSVGFDKPFLMREMGREGVVMPNPWHDSMIDYRNIIGKPYNLKAMCEHFGVVNEAAHRAVHDARATALCYVQLIEEAKLLSNDVRDIEAEIVGNELSGENIAITEESPTLSKHDALCLAKAHGATIQNNITKKSTMLLNLGAIPKTTGKYKKAEQYGVKIINEAEFRKIISVEQNQSKEVNKTALKSHSKPVIKPAKEKESMADILVEVKELHDAGIINDAEFNELKLRWMKEFIDNF